jgi:eukaryotic-like serine/threonine-protein kinase
MKSLNLFRFSKSKINPRLANITWASKSIGRTVTRTGVFLKRQIWIWPIVATIVLTVLAFGVRRAIESTMKRNLHSQLQTLLTVETAKLENLARVQSSNATLLANNPQVRESIYQLLAQQDPDQAVGGARGVAGANQQLRKSLGPFLSSHDYDGYLVADKAKHILSASNAELVGQTGIPEYENFLSRALEGETTVSPPFASVVAMKD